MKTLITLNLHGDLKDQQVKLQASKWSQNEESLPSCFRVFCSIMFDTFFSNWFWSFKSNHTFLWMLILGLIYYTIFPCGFFHFTENRLMYIDAWRDAHSGFRWNSISSCWGPICRKFHTMFFSLQIYETSSNIINMGLLFFISEIFPYLLAIVSLEPETTLESNFPLKWSIICTSLNKIFPLFLLCEYSLF